jgi:4-amino-4-deoxy-L-arabinose transferase-like glycosyltransferase
VPSRLADERFSDETKETIVLYGTGISRPAPDLLLLHNSPEYLSPPSETTVPAPVWTAPEALRRAALRWGMERWDRVNHEATEPPVYYALAGAWYRLGRSVGLIGGHLFYWTRFLNSLLFAGVVWVAYLFARDVCPGNRSLALGVPLLVATFPQSSFYGATNDSPLAPMLFAAALYALVRLRRDRQPWHRYVLAGVLAAATCLIKYSNAAILGAVLITLATGVITGSPDVRRHASKLALLGLAAVVPLAAWFTRNGLLSGDLTGSHQKYSMLGWSLKAPAALLDHPFFGRSAPRALFHEFAYGVLTTFWRGEITWHGQAMTLRGLEWFFSISSPLFFALAVIRVGGARDQDERRAIGMSAATVGLAVAALAVLSVVFDFGTRQPYPSAHWPYLVSGRLIAGILVPFATVYVYGLEWGLARVRCRGAALPVIAGLAILITLSQIVVTLPAFRSAYNWFHLP